jgi:hemoglobin
MQKAIAEQPYTDDFKDYLLTQLRVPAERIRQVNVINNAN